MSDQAACNSADRELWREPPGGYYANSIHVTHTGGIGIDVGGTVFVLPLAEWHSLRAQFTASASHNNELNRALDIVNEQLTAERERADRAEAVAKDRYEELLEQEPTELHKQIIKEGTYYRNKINILEQQLTDAKGDVERQSAEITLLNGIKTDFEHLIGKQADELNAQAAEVERLDESLNQIGIGGNHLALFLVGRLDPLPPYALDLGEAKKIIGEANDVFDAWICWRVIMLERDKHAAREKEKP